LPIAITSVVNNENVVGKYFDNISRKYISQIVELTIQLQKLEIVNKENLARLEEVSKENDFHIISIQAKINEKDVEINFLVVSRESLEKLLHDALSRAANNI
jgi:hypothetical protein